MPVHDAGWTVPGRRSAGDGCSHSACPAAERQARPRSLNAANGGNSGLTGRKIQGIGRTSPPCRGQKELSCRPRVRALPLTLSSRSSVDDAPAGLPAGVLSCGGDMRVFFFPSLRSLSAFPTGFLPTLPPCVLSGARRAFLRTFSLQPPSCAHPIQRFLPLK